MVQLSLDDQLHFLFAHGYLFWPRTVHHAVMLTTPAELYPRCVSIPSYRVEKNPLDAGV